MATTVPVIGTINDALKNITRLPTQQTPGGSVAAAPSGGAAATTSISSFQKLLNDRKGLQEDKMRAQEEQLQRLRTQQNNSLVQNRFARQASLVDLMQQLMTQARRQASQGSRIFM
jgi:hypothetical protein